MCDPKDQCGRVPLTTEMDGVVPCRLEATGTDSDGEACWSSKLFFFFFNYSEELKTKMRPPRGQFQHQHFSALSGTRITWTEH